LAHSCYTGTRRDAITEEGLAHFRTAYGDQAISRQDIFYYIYGLFHSPDYRTRFGDNLSKQLPRIPLVKGVENFRSFSSAGRKLAGANGLMPLIFISRPTRRPPTLRPAALSSIVMRGRPWLPGLRLYCGCGPVDL